MPCASFRKAGIGCLTLFCCSSVVWANGELPTYRAQNVTVTASPFLDFGQWFSGQTIDAETIEEAPQKNLPGLLRYQLGTPVLSAGGMGQSTSLFLRGAEARHTLFLIDGVQIGSATTGLAAIEHFPTAMLGRVDVFKGNMSALYGSGALGGVLNLTTKQNNEAPKPYVSMGVGNRRSYQLTSQYGGKVNDTQFYVGVNTQGTQGQTAMVDGTQGPVNNDDDSYHNQSVFASFSQKITDRSEVGLRLFHIHANTRYDNPYAASINDDQLLKSTNQAFIGYWKMQILPNWSSHLSLSETVDKMQDYNNGHKDSTFETKNRQIFWKHQIDIDAQQRVTAGVDWLEQRVNSSTDYDRTKRDVKSIYAGYQVNLSNHHVMANLRYDDYSDVGDATTYLLGYRYDLTPAWQLGANVGNAFTAPTFNHLYFPSFGNKDLKPEKSTNQEVHIQYRGQDFQMRLTGFHSRIRNLIGGYPIRNFAKSKITGVEAQLAFDFSPFLLQVNATLQNPKDRETGERLNRRTKQHGLVQLDYTQGPWRAGAQWFVSGNKIDNGKEIGGYGVLNLNLSNQIHKHWQIGAAIDNVFDRDYQELDGYKATERTLWLQLTYRP